MQTGKVIYEADTGLPEYLENGQIRKQDVQLHFDTIEESWGKLGRLSDFSYDEFMVECWYLEAAAHLLQTSSEALVDISRYVIRLLSLPSIDTYRHMPTGFADPGYRIY